jgi:serine/threonine-protein kinase RsbW
MAPLSLKGEPAEIGPAVEAVRHFALHSGLTGLAADALVVAVDEAISNILRHAYDEVADPAVTIEALADADGVEVTLTDSGRPFDPLEWVPPPLDGGAAERPVGGLGIHLMRSLVEQLTYRREGGANCLTLRKKSAAPLAGAGPGREDGPGIVGA